MKSLPISRYLPISIGLLTLLVLFVATFLARPILDPDFFWHLKVGEWLWVHKSWPIPDPFAFTTPENLEPWQIFIVKGYWLNQILYHFCYVAFGWWGFFLLRVVIFAAFVWILWKNRQGDAWLWWGCSLICLATIFDWYPLERPQFLSIVFFAWLYLLLDRIWAAQLAVSRQQVWMVALLMLVWGNLHRGFMLGQCLLLFSLAINLWWLVLRKENKYIADSRFWGLMIAGLIAGFVNPNAFRYLPTLLQTVVDTSAVAKDSAALMVASNFEYYSILKIWRSTGWAIVVPYAIFLVMALAVTVFSFRRQPLFSLVIFAGAAVYAAMHIRYLGFFMLAALPILVRGGAHVPLQRTVRWLMVACSVLVLTYLAYDERGNISKIKAEGWVSNRDFPVEVAEALASSNLAGQLFNTYGWGGYLLWRLGPERQVFIDGRNLNERVTRDALTAEMVDLGGGRMIWKEIFDKYQISHAVLPLVNGGKPYALTYAISRDPQWQIVYTSGNATLLVRRDHL